MNCSNKITLPEKVREDNFLKVEKIIKNCDGDATCIIISFRTGLKKCEIEKETIIKLIDDQ